MIAATVLFVILELPIALGQAISTCRVQGRYQLGEGWKQFAQHWDLGHGEQLQLSRRFVSSGCIWLDVQIERGDLAHSSSGMLSITTITITITITIHVNKPGPWPLSCQERT